MSLVGTAKKKGKHEFCNCIGTIFTYETVFAVRWVPAETGRACDVTGIPLDLPPALLCVCVSVVRVCLCEGVKQGAEGGGDAQLMLIV